MKIARLFLFLYTGLLIGLAVGFSPARAAADDCANCRLGEWFDVAAEVGPADAIVVLGGARNLRLPQGIALYRQGLAPALWYTGAHEDDSANAGYDAQQARRAAIAAGVPPASIQLLASSSTWEDGKEIASLVNAQEIQSIIVVTSWYHGRRALCSIRHHLAEQLPEQAIQVYYQPASEPAFGPGNWWYSPAGQRTINRELLKIAFYSVTYGVSAWDC
jgi:uncharacterized SAM-binding protein YcdF (DUF218 family)